jgi:hypothetical protein
MMQSREIYQRSKKLTSRPSFLFRRCDKNNKEAGDENFWNASSALVCIDQSPDDFKEIGVVARGW